MVEKLSIRIALEGGEEIERQLADMGKAGTKAFGEITKAAEKVGGFKKLDPTDLTNQLQSLGVTGPAAINKIQLAVKAAARLERVVASVAAVEGAFQKLDGGVTKFANRMSASLGPLGVFARTLGPVGIGLGVLGAGFLKAAFDVSDAISKITADAAKLNLPVKQFEQLRLGFEKAGISSGAIGDGLSHVQGLVDAFNLDQVKKAFKDLNVLGKTAFPGSNKLAFLREMAQGIGPAADAAREALKRLEQVDPFRPLSESMGPVDRIMKELGLTADTFRGKAATLRDLLPQIAEKFRAMPDSVERTQLAIELLGDKLGVELIGALRTGSFAIDQFKQQFGGLTQEQQVAAAQQEQSINRMIAAWNRFKAETVSPILTPAFDFLTAQIKQFQIDFTQITGDIKYAWDALKAIFNDPIGFGSAVWEGFKAAAVSAFQWIAEKWGQIKSRLGFGSSPGAPPSDATNGFAGGGLLGGRGTGTSDSNLAWVSRGEHIMPARAVAQPGVLAFLEALRRSGGNLSRVLDGMGRFALGGMVPRAMPAYATGGLAGGGNNVTIQFPGLPAIGGLRASTQVVDELRKAAVLAQVRSGGRKPSRYS